MRTGRKTFGTLGACAWNICTNDTDEATFNGTPTWRESRIIVNSTIFFSLSYTQAYGLTAFFVLRSRKKNPSQVRLSTYSLPGGQVHSIITLGDERVKVGATLLYLMGRTRDWGANNWGRACNGAQLPDISHHYATVFLVAKDASNIFWAWNYEGRVSHMILEHGLTCFSTFSRPRGRLSVFTINRKHSRCLLDQSGAKLKPIVTWSSAFSAPRAGYQCSWFA